MSFNPTMVRLLLTSDTFYKRKRTVSIPQWCDCCAIDYTLTQMTERGFNPTMVRLLHDPKLITFAPNPKFQSHNGAIAAL